MSDMGNMGHNALGYFKQLAVSPLLAALTTLTMLDYACHTVNYRQPYADSSALAFTIGLLQSRLFARSTAASLFPSLHI